MVLVSYRTVYFVICETQGLGGKIDSWEVFKTKKVASKGKGTLRDELKTGKCNELMLVRTKYGTYILL